jgi:hypothetical protein
MRISPLLVAAGSLLVGVTALCAVGVVEHRKARVRRPPPEPELDDAPPAPPRPLRPVEAPRRRPPPPPPPPALAELHVHVVGPHGIVPEGVEVTAHRRGVDDDEWTALDDDEAEAEDEAQASRGTFSTSALEPGRYDLRVQASGMRSLRLQDVPIGPKPLEVALARAPALLGSVAGMAAGGGCAQVAVTWAAGEGDAREEGEATVDADQCTFVVEELPDQAGAVTVVATRGARREAALVTVPLTGDPAFLCLAPPCATQPASLLVYVVDGDRLASGPTLSWTLQTDGLTGEEGMSIGSGLVWIHGRRAGETLALRAEGDDRSAELTTSVASGVTEVAVTLPRPSAWRPNCFDSEPDCSSTNRASDGDAENPNDHDQLRAVERTKVPLRQAGDRDLFVSRRR